MSDTTTANYGWVKPAVGGSNNTWGTKVNTDLDGIDSEVFTANTTADTVTATVANMGQFLHESVTGFNINAYETFFQVVSLSVPPGDWDVWGDFVMTGGVGGTVVAAWHAGISTVTDAINYGLGLYDQGNSVPNSAFGGAVVPSRLDLTAVTGNTTVYLNIIYFGSGGTSMPTTANIYARRWK